MSKEPTRRGFLQLLAGAGAGVLGTGFSGVATPASANPISTFQIPGVGSFPEYVTDKNAAQYLGDQVEGGTLSRQRNTALIRNSIQRETKTYRVGDTRVSIEPVAQSDYAVAYKASVDGQDYIIVQNNDVKGSDGSDFRCGAVFFPICDFQALPTAEKINQDQRAVEQALGHLTGKTFHLASYEANKGEVAQCRSRPQGGDNGPSGKGENSTGGHDSSAGNVDANAAPVLSGPNPNRFS